jgi:hypothetical protein
MGCTWVRPARRLLEQSPVITPQSQRAQSLVAGDEFSSRAVGWGRSQEAQVLPERARREV